MPWTVAVLLLILWLLGMVSSYMAILAGGLALAVPSVVHAQQSTASSVLEDALTPRELIAWSSLQTPQPAQQQLPVAQAHPGRDSERRPAAANWSAGTAGASTVSGYGAAQSTASARSKPIVKI